MKNFVFDLLNVLFCLARYNYIKLRSVFKIFISLDFYGKCNFRANSLTIETRLDGSKQRPDESIVSVIFFILTVIIIRHKTNFPSKYT